MDRLRVLKFLHLILKGLNLEIDMLDVRDLVKLLEESKSLGGELTRDMFVDIAEFFFLVRSISDMFG